MRNRSFSERQTECDEEKQQILECEKFYFSFEKKVSMTIDSKIINSLITLVEMINIANNSI